MRNHYILTAIQFVAGVALMAAGTASSLAGKTVQTNSMGLSKGSVFEVPEPHVYHYNNSHPGESKLLPRAYPGAPPQVPHDIRDFLPVTAESNMCIACHNQPGQWGQKREKGMAVPIPPSHYTDQRNAPGKVTEHLVGARYNCNLCHVAQTDAPALVGDTFSHRRAR